MWCPSVSLTLWTNAWLAGQAAPDDVLDALSLWAPRHSVTAYDSVAAQRTGLPWPDVNDAGVVSMLQTVRTAARPLMANEPPVRLLQPVPGDVRGLPAGTTFARDAIAEGEAVVITSAQGAPVGLVPESEDEHADGWPVTRWTAYSLPVLTNNEHHDLGAAEYELRSAVRTAAETLTALRADAAGLAVDDPRGMVEEILDAGRVHPVPDHAPCRALRVLENAAHVDAIITASAGLMPIATQSSSEAQLTDDALRPLATVVRSARLAAIDVILHSAWN